MLGWYLPGISDFPLGNRLFLLLAGENRLLFVLQSACMCPEHDTAGERGAIAGVGGRWRVDGGAGRNAVAVFVPRRRVCIETRGKHEWALSGLLMSFWVAKYFV